MTSVRQSIVGKKGLLVLAAGLSSRFGREDKLLAELKAKPLAQHCIDNLSPCNFDLKAAVLPLHNQALESLFTVAKYEIIPNSSPETGMGNSIKIGMHALNKMGAISICVVLADMPFVTSDHIEKLQQTYHPKLDACISLGQGICMPPIIFGTAAIDTLLATPIQDFDQARKAILNSNNIRSIALSESAAIDVDTSPGITALNQ